MVPVATALDQLIAPTTPVAPIAFPGTWGAVAATGGRVIVIGDNGSGSVGYHTFDLGSNMQAGENDFSVAGTGAVSTGDVATLGDRVFFTALRCGRIGADCGTPDPKAALQGPEVALFVYEGATTTPHPLRSVTFSKETRIPAINLVRDGRVSIAVTDKRVAVTWTIARTLGANDPVGGYAIFACTQ
jgi:hypothetical protein